MEKNTFKKAQYAKALDIWREKAEHEHNVQCVENGKEPNTEQWRDIFFFIAAERLVAFSAGIDGQEEPDTVTKLDEIAQGEPPLGTEFWEIIRDMIHQGYIDGQNARE